LEDTPETTITTIKVGEGAKGEVIYFPDAEVLTYRKEKGSGTCYYPLTVYCPKCSRTHEYNPKFKEWRPRWLIDKEDYYFNISYAKDLGGEIYPRCNKCGFDLRKDYQYGHQEEVEKVIKEEYHISISSAKYENGFFVLPLESFKKGVREAYSKKANLLISINNSTYKLGWKVYSNPDNIISKDNHIYLRRTLWSQA